MANDFTPYVPEWWAMGALAVLNEALVAVPLFNNDFSAQFAAGGEIINTRRPRKMTATRKHKDTAIVQQDVGADNVAVPLDQQIYNSFKVHDLDQQKSMQELISIYLRPAGFALAKQADAIVLAQGIHFLLAGNVRGTPNESVYNAIVDSRTLMDNNLAPAEGRNLVINPDTEGRMLKDNLLIQQYSAGSTQALRAGIVGRLVGVDGYKTQNLKKSSWNSGTVGVMSLTTNAAGVVGATTFTTAAQSTPTTVAGDWVSIAGVPYKVTLVSGAGPFTFTINRPLDKAYSSGLVIYSFKGITLNASYAVGHGEYIVLAPAANQFIPGYGDWVEINGKAYGIVGVDTGNKYLLDRPLEAVATAGTHLVQTIAPGGYNIMAQRDALTVVLRTLAPTIPGAGVRSATVSYNGMGVRAQMWYDATVQTMMVSLDFLMGIKVLDTNMGCVTVS